MQEKGFFKFHKVHNPKILVLNFFINDLEIIIPKKKNFIRNNFYSFSYLYYKYNTGYNGGMGIFNEVVVKNIKQR